MNQKKFDSIQEQEKQELKKLLNHKKREAFKKLLEELPQIFEKRNIRK